MQDQLIEIRSDVKELKNYMIDLVKQGAIHNQTLIEHERRSTNLEARFKPIEQTWVFVSKLSAVLITGGALTGSIAALLKAIKYLNL